MKGIETRRQVLRALAAGAGALALHRVLAQPAPRVLTITARRFQYEPNEIPLKVGEAVVVEIRSVDFIHGMNLPDLGRRYDLVPGQVARLELCPKEPGVIDFVCDNFCGDGHEEMHGRFVVS